MEKDTPFQIQSMIKPVVASAALILAADGKLQMDAPVSRYIPAFAHGRSQEIKIRNLMNHTSGFRIPSNFAYKTNAETPDGSTLQREVARLPEIGPAEVPGSSYEYSNPSYNTIAAVIEVASGKAIDVFLSDAIFKPLGMDHTYIRWKQRNEDIINACIGSFDLGCDAYVESKKGRPVPNQPAGDDFAPNPSLASPHWLHRFAASPPGSCICTNVGVESL